MIQYLLDANVIIALLNKSSPSLSQRIRQCAPAETAISSIVLHELFYGAFKSQRTTQNVVLVESLQFEVLTFDQEDARHAGEIRAFLSLQVQPIGPYDVLIAGQAKARNL